MKMHNARMTSNSDSDVVVFLIGMRVNRWWKFWQWLRVGAAMPRMLRELAQHPELGLLHYESWFGRTTMMLMYWKSTEHLIAYAKLRNAEHLPAWRAFNKHVGANGDVGIWHETYRVRARDYESVYVNMPTFGLGAAHALEAASGPKGTAEGRLGSAAPTGEALPSMR